MFSFLTHYIITFIHTTGYGGIFVVMAIGSALIPIPSEITLPFSGFLSQQGVFSFPLVVAVAAFGDLAGSVVSYIIGYFLEEELIVFLIKKHGKYLLLSEADYRKAASWFNSYGSKIVFFSKLFPGLRYFVPVAAGALRLNIWKFCFYTLLGSLIWCTFMVALGFYLGSKWDLLGPYLNRFQLVALTLLGLLVIWYITYKLKIMPFRKKKTKTDQG